MFWRPSSQGISMKMNERKLVLTNATHRAVDFVITLHMLTSAAGKLSMHCTRRPLTTPIELPVISAIFYTACRTSIPIPTGFHALLRAWAYATAYLTPGLAPGRSQRPTRRFSMTSLRSEEHTSELQSLMCRSYAVFCLKKKKINDNRRNTYNN